MNPTNAPKPVKLKPHEALILRTCNPDMTSYGGFRWPKKGIAEAPDWNPSPECGNGLHGFLRGEGNSALLIGGNSAIWIVAKIDSRECVDLGRKVKFPRANVIYAGDRDSAVALILATHSGAAVMFATLTGGEYATLTGGDRATLTGGYGATLTGGHGATLTGGDDATLTGGNHATLTGGDGAKLTGRYGATLTGGNDATLTGGNDATLTGGDGATLTFTYFDTRRRLLTVYVGENGIKPGTPYQYIGGKVVEMQK